MRIRDRLISRNPRDRDQRLLLSGEAFVTPNEVGFVPINSSPYGMMFTGALIDPFFIVHTGHPYGQGVLPIGHQYFFYTGEIRTIVKSVAIGRDILISKLDQECQSVEPAKLAPESWYRSRSKVVEDALIINQNRQLSVGVFKSRLPVLATWDKDLKDWFTNVAQGDSSQPLVRFNAETGKFEVVTVCTTGLTGPALGVMRPQIEQAKRKMQ